MKAAQKNAEDQGKKKAFVEDVKAVALVHSEACSVRDNLIQKNISVIGMKSSP